MIPLVAALALFTAPQATSMNKTTPEPAHTVSTFRFELAAPIARVAPLFGPEGERCWAGDHWDPHFLYPQPARDTPGAVFTIQHGPHTSLWVATAFDLTAGRMQYVSIIPGVVLTVVDVHLTAIDTSRTAVEVTYARTALDPTANEHIAAMGAADRDSGPHWQQSIEACLAAARAGAGNP
jgi:hypothetical protein